MQCVPTGSYSTRPGGDNTIRPGFGEVRLTADGSARAEWLDTFMVIPGDSALVGTEGRIVFKVREIVNTSGYSGVNPSVRSAYWPRDRVSGTQFITHQWTTPSNGDPIQVDREVEVNLAIAFFRGSRIEMRTQAFANDEADNLNIVASHEILEIVKILDPSGQELSPLAICTASGKQYNLP